MAPSSSTSRLKPPALQLGDVVGIVAPASNVNREQLEAGCESLRRAGYRPFYLESVFEKDLYFAGSVARRVHELEEMFVRDDVRAIICARGGYGSNYLLRSLNLETIRARPKIFVGYSDQTALLTLLCDAAGLVVFHGPMVAKDWSEPDGVDLNSWQAALHRAAVWNFDRKSLEGSIGLVDGAADGILYGGCLSILVASLGTPYEIRTLGTILFIEDIAAKPYQIDRMLMQLKLAGKFKGVRGLIFGEMKNCYQVANQGNYTLQEVVMRIIGDLGIPVAYGFRSGHVTAKNVTLPIGVSARLVVSGDRVDLQLLESAVQEF